MGLENKKSLYVKIRVKPYCYRYLCNNYSLRDAPEGYIDLRGNRLLLTALRTLLRHKTKLRIKQPPSDQWRNKEVFVYVGPHHISHNGIDIAEEHKVVWAILVEQICQEDFKNFFFNMYMADPRIFVIIEHFKRMRGYTENDWPDESLRKIVFRMDVKRTLDRNREEYLKIYKDFYCGSVPSTGLGKNIQNIAYLCNSILTTGEASEESMPSQTKTSSASTTVGA